jgi:hypothetical protein
MGTCLVIYIICRVIEVGADLSKIRVMLNLQSFMGFCFNWKQFVKSVAFCSKINIPVNAWLNVQSFLSFYNLIFLC